MPLPLRQPRPHQAELLHPSLIGAEPLQLRLTRPHQAPSRGLIGHNLYNSVNRTTVGMQACGDVMIGQHGRSVHEAIPHNCGAKTIPTSLLLLPSSSPRIKIVSRLNQRLRDELTSLMTLLLVVNLTC